MKFRPLLFLVFLVFALSSCQSAFFTDLVTASGQALYRDDFSDSSGGWRQSSDSDSSQGYSDGAYYIQVQATHYILWAASGHAYKNMQVEADATRLAGPQANLFGLVCRAKDESNFYFFAISSDGYYGIGKIRQGVTSLIDQEMMLYSPLVPQEAGTVHLRFDCTGPALTGYVNGQQVAAVRDADFASGDAGLIAGTLDVGGVDVAFDNFVVIKP